MRERQPFTLAQLDAAIEKAKESGIVTPFAIRDSLYYMIYSPRDLKALIWKLRRMGYVRRYLRKGSLKHA